MIALDYTIIVQIVSFLLLWFFLSRLLFRPFLRLLEEREQRTEGARAEAALLREEAERLRAEYEEQVMRAKDEGASIKEALRHEAAKARERLLGEARETASRRLEAMRAEMQRELQRGRELGAREADAVGAQMVEKILGRKVG
ncbi:MAG: ATP synthase F0 subunit B [Candidatus Binatia bacterium]